MRHLSQHKLIFVTFICYISLIDCIFIVSTSVNINNSSFKEFKKTEMLEDTKTQTQPVRCFCNLPECVRNGYMCKSAKGVCFSKYLRRRNSHAHDAYLIAPEVPNRGCLELLPENQRQICKRKAHFPAGGHTSSGSRTGRGDLHQLIDESDLHCCQMNVCNFGNILPTVHVRDVKDLIGPVSTSHADWFRAATIAVPIAGGAILIALVVFAGKMLVQDTKCQETKRHQCFKMLPSHDPYAGPDAIGTISVKPVEESENKRFGAFLNIDMKQPSDKISYPEGVFNHGASSSTIYSKDFTDAILEENVPLNKPFESHSV